MNKKSKNLTTLSNEIIFMPVIITVALIFINIFSKANEIKNISELITVNQAILVVAIAYVITVLCLLKVNTILNKALGQNKSSVVHLILCTFTPYIFFWSLILSNKMNYCYKVKKIDRMLYSDNFIILILSIFTLTICSNSILNYHAEMLNDLINKEEKEEKEEFKNLGDINDSNNIKEI